MSESAALSQPPRVDVDDPAHWLGSSALLDLEDTRLRLRVRALTQLCKTDREKALAIYAFVKRIPFTKPLKLNLRTAREVLDMGRGDSQDKATLLVALLRLARIPARMRFIQYRGEVMRGLLPRLVNANRPVIEAWLGGQWVRHRHLHLRRRVHGGGAAAAEGSGLGARLRRRPRRPWHLEWRGRRLDA